MKSVKILSMQRVPNHGSFLQGYGLKKLLESLGTETTFLDIRKGEDNSSIVDSRKSEMSDNKKYKRILRRFIMRFRQKEQNRLFKNQMSCHLGVTEERMDSDKCDVAVIGSDEVFNCVSPSRWGFSSQLFGDIPGAKKVITYAASCGRTTYEALTAEFQKKVGDSLNKLSAVSVRDENTRDFVCRLSDKQPIMHLDPVLIYDYKDELQEHSFKHPYLLLYSYTNRISNPKEIKAIKAYAKKHNLKIVCSGVFQYWCNYNIPVTSFELLSYFKNAACVVTDTFHGTILSAKYNKEFVSIVRNSNKNKLSFLLFELGLSERECVEIEDLEKIMSKPIDYKKVNEIISSERVKTIEYLKSEVV